MNNPFYTANYVERFVERTNSSKMGTAFMYMSGALVLLMLVKEGRELFFSKSVTEAQRQRLDKLYTRCYDREESKKHQRS